MIDSSRKENVVLQAKEWLTLIEWLGIQTWQDPEHPFHVFLQAMLDSDAEDTRETLKSKEEVSETVQGARISLPQHVLDDLTAASAAVKACWLTYTCGKQTSEEYLHITGNQIIRFRRLPGKINRLFVERITEGKQLSVLLAGRMKWNSRTPGELPALMMSRKQFDAALSQARELELNRLATLLADMTNDEEGSIALAKCMKSPLAHGDIRFYANCGGRWEIQQMQFMNNPQLNWLIRCSAKDEEDWMIATPTPRQQFQKILLKWFRKPHNAE